MPQLEVSKEERKINSGTNIYLGQKSTAAARGCCGSFEYGVLKSVGVAQMLKSNFLHMSKELTGEFSLPRAMPC